MTINPMPTGDEVDDALRIIEENGGLGNYETGEAGEVERFLFPRFPGADSIGTCSAKAKSHKGIHTETDKCKNFEVDMGSMYLSRSGLGPHVTDVQTICAWLDAPRTVVGAVLALSEPGTGKTALIEAAVTYAERKLLTVLCTPDHNRDSLFLKFVGEGNGDCLVPDHDHGEARDDFTDTCQRTAFTLGPIPFAAKYGYVLYMDEVMMLIDGVKPLLYALADGRHFLPEGNIDGSPLPIHPDFRLVMSSNPLVRGASLPEPIASRCAGTTIHVETSEQMLLDLNIDEAIVSAWSALGTSNLWRPAIREMRVADYWFESNPDQAVSAMVPEHCPESMREAVTNIVMSHIGGDIRRDGRMVVR